MARTIFWFRWTVFLLAAFYCLRMLFFSDWASFGGPFRYLTVWALFLSFFAASRMMALMEGRSTRRWDGYVSAVSVVNAMVVILYWRLWFADPYSVQADGQLGVWWLELYLHGLGPLLQWIDATFIHRAYRRLGAAALWTLGIVVAFVLWMEFVLQPLNATPRGSVTTGLSYPFLNSLLWEDRLAFYGSNIAAAMVLLLVFAGIAWAVRRSVPALMTMPGLKQDMEGAPTTD